MAGTKEIKRRIKSISSTKKITRAMQMISAVKMRKAQIVVLASRSYADLAWQIIGNLQNATDSSAHPLLQLNVNAQRIGVLLITPNRGQVGSLNTNLVAKVAAYVRERKLDAHLVGEIATLGKKGRVLAVRMDEKIFAEFEKSEKHTRIDDIFPVAKLLTDEYARGTYREIVVAYTKFNSTLKQTPTVTRLLPFERGRSESYGYLYEPDPADVLDHLLPRIVESQIYQAVLESNASEHSARMVMMANATDAAGELITDLTLSYNQVRQANITQELAELTAGRIALE
jgi:F-type H+-transporting ATPase subunit gamma